MGNKSLVKIIILIVLLCLPSFSYGEEIYLKSGSKVTGKIIERTDKYIKVDFMGVVLTYWLDEIEQIGEEAPLTAKENKANLNLIVVGDALLTYASYLFELSSNWVPDIPDLQLTHERGFWRGKHKNGNVWIQVVPSKIEDGKGLSDFVNMGKQQIVAGGGCSPESMSKNYVFKPLLNYPYETYFLNNCPQGSYGLIVFAELPHHVITFNLYGELENKDSLNPYLEDFKKVISSFRWTLGLSDEEIARIVNAL